MKYLVIGVGNSFRRDDGVGLAVAESVARLQLPGLEVLLTAGEPAAILDAWADVDVAVAVDAASTGEADPGRIQRWTPDAMSVRPGTSSHELGLPQAYALGRALGRAPRSLVVLTVEMADAGLGTGLSAPVAAAVPGAVDAVLAEFGIGRPRDFRQAIKD